MWYRMAVKGYKVICKVTDGEITELFIFNKKSKRVYNSLTEHSEIPRKFIKTLWTWFSMCCHTTR